MKRQAELDLYGKVVVLTGATKGMGREAALRFARRGANLVLAARHIDINDEAIAAIVAVGTRVVAVPTDLGKREDLRRLIEEAATQLGGIDILVNNAGTTDGSMWNKRFLDLTYEEWLHPFDINLHAPFELMQMAVPIMEARGGGRIINLSACSAEALRLPEEPVKLDSLAGINLIVPGYFASKKALDRLASVIAPDLAARNVFVVSLHPGWVATERVTESVEKAPPGSMGERRPVSMAVPARMMVYFAACENPSEYTGRVFWAERELELLGLSTD